MYLLDLPLECFRCILSEVILDVGFQQCLTLRLVNGLFDREVMIAIGNAKLLETFPAVADKSICSHPLFTRYPGYVDFLGSYLLCQPRPQEPWNATIPALLNRVVDEVMAEEGLDVDHPSRAEFLRPLCRDAVEKSGFEALPRFCTQSLFRRGIDVGTEDLSIIVFLAKLLLGRGQNSDANIKTWSMRRSRVFGTLLGVASQSGRIDLIRAILKDGPAIPGESPEVQVNGALGALVGAVEGRQEGTLRALLEPEFRTLRSRREMASALMRSIGTGQVNLALLLLASGELRLSGRSEILSRGFTEACCRGYVDVADAMWECGVRPGLGVQQYAAWFSQEAILRSFFNKGVRPDTLALRAAAMTGNTNIAQILVDGGAQVRPMEWCQILTVAVEQRQGEFVRFLFEENIINVETLREDEDSAAELMMHSCVCGDLFMIKTLVAGGMPVGGETYRPRPPILCAHMGGQSHIVEALLELGATMIDPLESDLKGEFEAGRLPREWPPKKIRPTVNGILRWEVMPGGLAEDEWGT
ncbi:Uu.00g000510.m01.CDS01 [Anthostomella pinea]|uniref:Uu.00g000510.m01.CDS01 n=1 Tax=Anthostomella pinea TaxID=933095 RepID=A0AAI8VJY0_9PEZI|nr:Uu.00g000510.m01.CDS01 [Anthostomella pinea]